MRKKGFAHMVYNPRLHYIHLTKEREPNLAYEIKLLDVAIAQSRKKGCLFLMILLTVHPFFLSWPSHKAGRNDAR